MRYKTKRVQLSSMYNNLNLYRKSISKDISIFISDQTRSTQLDGARQVKRQDQEYMQIQHAMHSGNMSDKLNQKWIYLCKNTQEECGVHGKINSREKNHMEWKPLSVIRLSQMYLTRCLFRGILHRKNKYRSKLFAQNGLSSWITLFTFVIYVILSTSPPTAADYYSDYVSVIMKNYNSSACDGEYLRIDCPTGTSIDIQKAMYGRKVPSSVMCPSTTETGSGSSEKVDEDTDCEAVTSFEKTGAECQDKRICRLLVHRRVFGQDPCPGTSKYLTVHYKCAPKDFHELSTCSRQTVKLRCRLDTVISIFDVIPSDRNKCSKAINKTNCVMRKSAVLEDVTLNCHSKEKCSYMLPSSSCFNHMKIVHTCVPKEFLTSELPSSVRLLTTTSPALDTTQDWSTEHSTVVHSTVTTSINSKGESTSFSPTSTSFIIEDTSAVNLSNTTGDISAGRTRSPPGNFTTTSYILPNNTSDFTGKINNEDDVIINNDFPIIKDQNMDTSNNFSPCVNCTSVNVAGSGNIYDSMMGLYLFLKENSDDIVIAILLAVVLALLLTICVLVLPCKFKHAKKKENKAEEPTENSRLNVQEEYSPPAVPVEEDEHENMSLMGSILQRSVSSTNTLQRQQITSTTPQKKKKKQTVQDESKSSCGPQSIFAKICCNCCCNNAPWQRTRILKRHRGDVYRVTHRYSSSLEDEELAGRFQSRETFPVFSRTDDNVDNQSPIPALEDHANRSENTVASSAPPTTQENINFRPISRSTQRHYSATPEPDYTRRTNQTFRPGVRHESQRSDPALNIYSVHNQYNTTQPMTAPTSPIISHQAKIPNNYLNGTHNHFNNHAQVASTPKSPQMGISLTHNSQLHIAGAHVAPPQSPRTPKYTPPPTHFYSTQQYTPSFTEAFEQYDNAQQRDMAVRKKQFHRPQYSTQYSHEYNPNNGNYSGYYTQNNYGDQFVQAVQRRTIPSNARTVDLAANARTVDLSHDNSLSRNSWLEIRRSSIYDNSLPRNSEMYEYYNQLQQQEMHHNLVQHHDLPGSRNLNHYY
uniref:uncharacterized protein LOC120342132 isoform X1 n=1 Tax=Styela clava TaxID=7725 RepID=UPI0019396D9A|nr:uncharacterized protein LOC120342132 isoform X1 [Styela clava]